jgi:hypothetical protein
MYLRTCIFVDLRTKGENFPTPHQHAASYNREVGIYCAVGGAIYPQSQNCEQPL